MKFSYNWLRELVQDLSESRTEIERLITIHTAESEGIEQIGDDYVIEVDNKSLTHRPDLWGHYGMAREVAAITGRKLLDPVTFTDFSGDPRLRVSIDDYDLCRRYSALAFENVTVQPSPVWLQKRLEAAGMNPINNIVDVTNYVLAEIAQPMHAFDRDKLTGNEIRVRSAQPDEKIAALNDQTYELDSSNLVIADTVGAIAIAGIIGGADSSISQSTTRIVLESANFNASNIRKTSSRLKIRTDASMRFEKAQDPVNTIRGLERAWALLQEVSPGIRRVGGLADAYRPLAVPPPIVLALDWLDRKLGRAIPEAEVRRILEALEFKVEDISPRVFSVFVPSWRATKDISLREDLVEEVGRMIGYDTITPIAPLVPAQVPPASPERVFHHRVRRMAATLGFTEVCNYSFVSEEMARAFSLNPEDHAQVANPIASDHNLLRVSLLPGIWKNIQDNARNFDNFRLFEIGREIHKDHEAPHLVAAIFSKDDGTSGLFELKHLAEALLSNISVRPSTAPFPYEHPHRAADVMHDETSVGRLFEFHPSMIEAGRAAILDLNLKLLQQLQPSEMRYRPIRRFPSSAFDLSVVVPSRTWIGNVQGVLEKLAGEMLISIVFLRSFNLPSQERSLSYRITIGASDRTLSADEVGAIRSGIIEGMRTAGYDLRV